MPVFQADASHKSNQCGGEVALNKAFLSYGALMTSRYSRAAVLLLTGLLFSLSLYGYSSHWEVDYDPGNLVGPGNYLRDYLDADKEFFPDGGVEAAVYLHNVSRLHAKMDVVKQIRLELGEMAAEEGLLSAGTSGRGGLDEAFEFFVVAKEGGGDGPGYPARPLDRSDFDASLGEFLCASGRPYRDELVFDGPFQCPPPDRLPDITLMSVPYQHKK